MGRTQQRARWPMAAHSDWKLAALEGTVGAIKTVLVRCSKRCR